MEHSKSYLAPFIANLQSESKRMRKDTLDKIISEVFLNPIHEPAELPQFFTIIHPYITKSLADKSEACRESAVKLLDHFVDKLPLNDYYLTYIIPTLVRRIGCPEIIEESEEIRLLLVCMVNKIIETYKDSLHLRPFFNDFICILTKTCTDPFPKVKKEACISIIKLSEALKQDFHMQSESLVKPVLSNFMHQHFRVRVEAVRCIGAIVMNGNGKCFEDSITPMAERLFDDNALVRLQVTQEVGVWMKDLRDRYSFWHRMIPLILTSTNDAIVEIRDVASKLWTEIGLQFMDENEEELKKMTDFLTDIPTHYPNVPRPNLGCRILVQRNIGKIVPAIARGVSFRKFLWCPVGYLCIDVMQLVLELDGWQSDPRLRVSQLLCCLLLCAEAGATQHAPVIIGALLRGAQDDDPRIILEIKRAAELLGYFIYPETWWPLLKPEIEKWNCLFILANILKGTHSDHLRGRYLNEICKELSDKDHCQTRKAHYQMNLLRVMESIMEVCKQDSVVVSKEIFIICFTVYSMAADKDIQFHSFENLKTLSHLEKVPNMDGLYESHIGYALSCITSEATTWTLLTPDRCILEAVISNTGAALGQELHLIAPLLKECLGKASVDPEVKLKMFTALSTALISRQQHFKRTEPHHLEAFLTIILQEVILPNLVWTPGRTAEAIRTSAIACLCSALQETPKSTNHGGILSDNHILAEGEKEVHLFLTMDSLASFLDSVMPLIIGLLDDNATLTRQYALRAVSSLVRIAHSMGCFTADRLNKCYHVVLKRLDDANDKVRSFAVQTLVTLFCNRPPGYDLSLYRAHVDAMYSAMLIHLDDPEEMFRKEMLEALTRLCDVDPELLNRKLNANIHLYRNKAAYERLSSQLKKISLKPETTSNKIDSI